MKTLLKIMLVSCLSIAYSNSIAGEVSTVSPGGDELFKDYDKSGKLAKNISGVVCFDAGNCLVISDEMIGLQKIKLSKESGSLSYSPGQHFGSSFGELCSDISDKDECEEVDLEGVARNGNSVLITGSMGNKRKSAKKDKARWFVAELSFDENQKLNPNGVTIIDRKKHLKKLFSEHDEISPYIGKPLQCFGLNIEGLAWINSTIYFGLRSPAKNELGRAYVLSSAKSNLTQDSDLESPTKLHSLTFKNKDGEAIENVGIRALEPFGEKLIIVTGDARVAAPKKLKHWDRIVEKCEDVIDEDDALNILQNAPVKSRIWIWDPRQENNAPKELAVIKGKYEGKKLEGVAVLGDAVSPVSLLLAFDGVKKNKAIAVLDGVVIPE